MPAPLDNTITLPAGFFHDPPMSGLQLPLVSVSQDTLAGLAEGTLTESQLDVGVLVSTRLSVLLCYYGILRI